jgi:alpha-N-acetylglucosamine transferase
MASNFYRQVDSPRYKLGHGLELGFISMGIVASIILILSYNAVNKKRAQRLADGEAAHYTPEELSALGDRAITFRYMF